MTDPLYVKYNGPSMSPLLKAGDVLRVVPYKTRPVRVGDVLVFQKQRDNRSVAHRVVGIGNAGIRTRGDNNPDGDPGILTREKIIGRVIAARRGRLTIQIKGGRQGIVYARIRWCLKWIDLTASRLLHPLYHGLAKTGILRKTLRSWINYRIICFNKAEGVEMQLLIGRWVVGRRFPGQPHWHIRRPFRLFIDEDDLMRKGRSFEIKNAR